MRDQHKLKEKYEIDNRQIISLTFVGLLVLGGAFILGVMVGKKLQAEQSPAERPDLLSALDKKTDTLDAMQRDASLTFQQELTKASPKLLPDPAPIVVPPPAVKPEAAPLVAVAAKPDASEVMAVIPTAPKPEPVAAVKNDVPKTEEVATRTATTKDAGALRDAIARATRPAEAAVKPTETSPDGQWTLQLSAYQNKDEADRFSGSLRDKGYAPFIVEAAVAGKGTWYRVRMGRFPSKEAASRYLADFKRETQIEAFVTNAH